MRDKKTTYHWVSVSIIVLSSVIFCALMIYSAVHVVFGISLEPALPVSLIEMWLLWPFVVFVLSSIRKLSSVVLGWSEDLQIEESLGGGKPRLKNSGGSKVKIWFLVPLLGVAAYTVAHLALFNFGNYSLTQKIGVELGEVWLLWVVYFACLFVYAFHESEFSEKNYSAKRAREGEEPLYLMSLVLAFVYVSFLTSLQMLSDFSMDDYLFLGLHEAWYFWLGMLFVSFFAHLIVRSKKSSIQVVLDSQAKAIDKAKEKAKAKAIAKAESEAQFRVEAEKARAEEEARAKDAVEKRVKAERAKLKRKKKL